MSELPKPGQKMYIVTTEANPAAAIYGHTNPEWAEKGGRMQLAKGYKYNIITVTVEKVETKDA